MFKNLKKLFFAMALVFICAFAFACGEQECPECDPAANAENCVDYCEQCTELNKENCSQYCDECEKCEKCEECVDLNKENCKDYCDTCPDPEKCDYVAPTEFAIFSDSIRVGSSSPNVVEDELPVGAYKGVYWESSNPEIVTVDGNGLMTAIRPGEAVITATSVLNPDVKASETVVAIDPLEENKYDLCAREVKDIVAQIPAYSSKSFDFPEAWNQNVEVIIKNEALEEVKGFVFPEGLTADKRMTYTITVKYGSDSADASVVVWATPDSENNSYVRVNQAVAAANIILRAYVVNGEKVTGDIDLPDYIYGVAMNWSSTLKTYLGHDGKYVRPDDDKKIRLSITPMYGENSLSPSFDLVVKGYDKDEKIKYILEEGSLASFNKATVNTSLVLPVYDSKFKAELSYVSSKPEIIGNDGKIVALPTEATEVEFTATIKYANAGDNSFEETAKFTVTVAPATDAGAAAEEWLQASAYKAPAHFPWGQTEGNVLDVPTTYTKGDKTYNVTWDTSKALVTPKYIAQDDTKTEKTVNAFEIVEGKPKLVVQYLRYTQVEIKGTFTNTADAKDVASVTLVLNIGVSADAKYAYTGTWESADQGDTSLTIQRGLFDLTDNASHFDQTAGLTKRVLGWGFWSGVKITAPTYDGIDYETFIMDYMYWEVKDDGKGGVVKDALSLFNNAGDMGGNWGWLLYNSSSQDIKIEVGTYSTTYVEGDATTTFEDGTACDKTIGSRISYAMDGYALGFVTDKDGKVLYGSEEGKLQNNIPKQTVKIGSAEATNLFGDSKSGEVCYLVVPAGGYAMSWKYQFYGLGNAASVYAFCQEGVTLDIEHYDVHPLNSQFAEYAAEDLVAAEEAVAAGAKAGGIEAYANRSRLYFDQLKGDTKVAVFDAARLEAVETKVAELLDAEITDLLAKDKPGTEINYETAFVEALGQLYTRLEKDSTYIIDKMTKKAEFDALFVKYSSVDLTVTLDYDGGFATGLYGADDFDKVIPQMLSDLYDHMVAQGAFQKKIENDVLVDDATLETPTRDVFCSSEYWTNNYAVYANTVLGQYLFTPAYTDGAANENYMGVIEGSNKFFNQEEYNKWVTLFDYTDEATRAGHMGGQDAWGRTGENYAAAKYITSDGDLTTYGGNVVVVTNAGTLLGAYRFAQFVVGKIAPARYANKIPADVYFATFDRQTTQERYSKIVYHCTDATVELPKAPVKEGYIFNGWVYEDGTKAEIVGSMFKDITVKASWLVALEQSVEKEVGKDLTGVYYAANETGEYKANTEPGTLADQAERVGLGNYAIIVGDKLFVMPKYAYIALGDGITAATALETKEQLQKYGTDGSTQTSTGLIYDAAKDTVTAKNSYGHGALYQNISDFDLTVTLINTYGRNLDGAGYGYNRYLFSFDAEKKVYIGTKVGSAGTAVLKPGDFLWCPMTADRFCSGLTDCDGTSGVVGVLSDGCEVTIMNIEKFVPAESPAWHSVLFMNGDDVVAEWYPEEGQAITKPADLKKSGFDFMGWNTDKDATEGIDVVLTPTEDATYYAIWKELSTFDAVTVDAAYTGDDPQTFTTFAAAINSSNPNAVVTVKAGTYAEDIVVNKALTFNGPYANVFGNATRTAEADIQGTVTINAGLTGVTFNGFKFSGDDTDKMLIEPHTGNSNKCKILALGEITDFTFTNNLVTCGKVFIELAKNNNTVISNNFFNWTAEAGTPTDYGYWRPMRFDGVSKDFKFVNNKVVQTARNASSTGFYDLLYFANAQGVLDIKDNDILLYAYNWAFNVAVGSGLTDFNVIGNVIAGDATTESAGFAITKLAGTTNVNIIANKFNYVAGTTFSVLCTDETVAAASTAKYNISYNQFAQDVYKLRINKNFPAANLTHANNYIKAEAITAAGDSYYTFTKDGNFATIDELKASYGTAAGSLTVTSFATGYVNGTKIYMAKKYQFNAYYEAKVAVKYNAEKARYEVVGDQQKTPTLVAGQDYDFLIALHSACNNADAIALAKGLAVGTVVEFVDQSQFALNSLVKGDVQIVVNFYTPAA